MPVLHIIDPPRKKVAAPIINLKFWCTLSLSNNFIFRGMEIVAEIAAIPTIDPKPKSNTNPKPCQMESTVPKATILRAADPARPCIKPIIRARNGSLSTCL